MNKQFLDEPLQFLTQLTNDFLTLIPQSARQATAAFASNSIQNLKNLFSNLEAEFEKYKVDAENKLKAVEEEFEKYKVDAENKLKDLEEKLNSKI